MLGKDLILQDFQRARKASLEMLRPLNAEECRIQPIPEVSPPWWNLAHTSWFFTRNVLRPFGGEIVDEDSLFDFVLNSYYVSLGERLERTQRGNITRPTMQEVYEYRTSVDRRVENLIHKLDDEQLTKCAQIIKIGIQHEEQHQELFYTEIKFILYQNPLLLRKAYRESPSATFQKPEKSHSLQVSSGIYEFGNLEREWGFDNEYPVHKYYIQSYSLQNRLVTNAEYLEFMDDGGYESQLLWLDNGWNKSKQENWKAPLYWERLDGEWHLFTLSGMKKLKPEEPLCHVSFYEAEAFATWKNARLPTEREWELACRIYKVDSASGNFLDSGFLHPAVSASQSPLQQMLGDVWEWTCSYYEPYLGYKPFDGALSEYNEKFMDNQRILRGGSCVSERSHIRISYRNFWPAETRFQFSGIRLANNEK